MPSPTRTRPTYRFIAGGALVAEGARFELGSEPLTVGRGPAASVRVDDPLVSALHCELRAGPRGVELRDLGSTNGTWIGGVSVIEARLQSACGIRVGETELAFEASRDRQLDDYSAEPDAFGPLVGGSIAMRKIYRALGAVAPTELSVLLMAETGTGKELAARAIHDASPRRGGPFVVVDCAALPASLAESILFGHERGAFTGASTRRDGVFQEASGGTLFVDELGELPDEVQPKLLRAVAERSVKRVGGSGYEAIDVRIIAATRRDLRREINAKRFREDLFYRLAQVQLELPRLKDRRSDIPELVRCACERVGRAELAPKVTQHILARFRRYDWPGNVRELVNIASVLASIGDGAGQGVLDDVLPVQGSWPLAEADTELAPRPTPECLGAQPAPSSPEAFVQAKRQFEEQYFRNLLSTTDGNISEIARRCGLARHQVRAHLRKLGLGDGSH